MSYLARIALFAGALSLAACDARSQPEKRTLPKIVATAPGTPPPEAHSPPSPPAPARHRNPTNGEPYAGTNDGYPDLAPNIGPEDRTEKGARALLLAWARGIELREFDQSWKMMGEAAKPQVSKSAFNAMFAQLHDLSVAVPTGTMEGAAGSSYYTVPITVSGTARGGDKQTMKGDLVMRRVNDIDGASPEQLTWHIERVDLKPS